MKCKGSPTQAELGQAGGVPIPPSTPSSNGRYANEPGGKGSGKGSGCGLPCAGSAMPCLFPGGFGGNSMPADAGFGLGVGNAQGCSFGNVSFPQNVANLNSCAGNPMVGQNPSQNFCGSFQQLRSSS